MCLTSSRQDRMREQEVAMGEPVKPRSRKKTKNQLPSRLRTFASTITHTDGIRMLRACTASHTNDG